MITINDVMTEFNALFGSETPVADRSAVHAWLTANRGGWMHGSAHDAAAAAYASFNPWTYRVTDDGTGGHWAHSETAENEEAARDIASDLLDGGVRAVSIAPADGSAPGVILVAEQQADGDWIAVEHTA